MAGLRRFASLPMLLLAASVPAAQDTATRPAVRFETTKGAFTIELFGDKTPKTVANFLRYVEIGFYDDTIFHRVIEKFVVQGGGFTPELALKQTLAPIDIESRRDLPNVRGSVAMARTADQDSATSQFFVNLRDNDNLDRAGLRTGYTVFGRVTEGMDVIDRIARVQTGRRGPMRDVPILPVIVTSARRVDGEH